MDFDFQYFDGAQFPKKDKIYGGKAKGMPTEDLISLYRVLIDIKPKSVLEIGTYHGFGTNVIANAIEDTENKRFVTVDNVQDKLDVAKRNNSEFNFIEYVCSDELEYLRNCKDKFDVIFHDGVNEILDFNNEEFDYIEKMCKVIIIHDVYHRKIKKITTRGQILMERYKNYYILDGVCGIGVAIL